MGKSVKIAITQMNVAPEALEDRLQRAGDLVQKAASLGAELVVLPELFNSGYAYHDDNFTTARMHNQLTEQWMREMSASCAVYLAGSLFHFDENKIFNALYLIAPNGKTWRYDKNYPWGWERAYFEAGDDIQIAETELGRIGFMLCWDVAHAALWRKYAGKVDLILSCTCPPNIPNAKYYFPDGKVFTADALGPLFAKMQHSANQIFVETPAQQCQWLGVPYISSTGCGKVKTRIPNPRGSFLGALISKPALIRYLPKADQLTIEAEMVEAGRIYGADGHQIAQLKNTYEDGLCLAEVEINTKTEAPVSIQPKPPISGLVRFVSDWLLTSVSTGTYRRGLRKISKM